MEMYSPDFREVHIHTGHGNNKIGDNVLTCSTLPGSKPLSNKEGKIYTDVHGTCHGCCEGCNGCEENGCYAINYVKRWCKSCIPAYADNTVLLRNDMERFFYELHREIEKAKEPIVRPNISGEMDSFEFYVGWWETAKKYEDKQFYNYTKRFEWLEELPQLPNFVNNVSIFLGNYDNPYGYPEFIFDDGSDPSLAKVFHCPAVSKEGKPTGIKCKQCRRCEYAKKGQRTAVYKHR